MRTSSKISITLLAVLAILVVGFVLASRFLLTSEYTGASSVSGSQSGASREVVKSFEESDFKGVEISGVWDLEIRQHAEYSVEVSISEQLLDSLDIHGESGILHIDFSSEAAIRSEEKGHIILSMPYLESVVSSGQLDAEFNGFTGERLTVRTAGALSLLGSDSSFAILDLTTIGAAEVRLGDVPVDSASVAMSGAGVAELQLGDGTLEGNLSGACMLFYSGSPEEVDVSTSGVSTVTERARG